MNEIEIVEITLRSMSLGLCIFGSAFLLLDRRLRRAAWGLALFFLLSAVDQADSLINMWEGYEQFLWFGGLTLFSSMLYGPAIYCYTRTMTDADFRPSLRTAVVLFGTPLLIASISYVPLARLPESARLALLTGQTISDPALATLADRAVVFSTVAFLIVTLASLALAWRQLDRNDRRIRRQFSNIEDKTMAWLRYMMVLLLAAWFWALGQSFLGTLTTVLSLPDYLDSFFSFAWVWALVFFGIRQVPINDNPSNITATRPDPSDDPTVKYSRSALDKDRMKRLAEQLEREMVTASLYNDPNLSLRLLSDRLRTSPNYLSQTLNDYLGVNFFDFVNGYRIAAAKTLLKETSTTITGIALDVGFNSRSTFNAAFKKHVGQSPTDFRRSET